MLKLSIMSEEELTHIFGNLDAYIPLHEDFLAQLTKATAPDGTVGRIGQIVVDWVSVPSPRTSASSTRAWYRSKKCWYQYRDFNAYSLNDPFFDTNFMKFYEIMRTQMRFTL